MILWHPESESDWPNGRRYVAACDRCGDECEHCGADPRMAANQAALAGWHCPSVFPGENFMKLPVQCPRCRMINS